MKELTLTVEKPQLKINGHVFDLHMNDLDIYMRSNEIVHHAEQLVAKGSQPEQIIALLKEAYGFLDEMLGEGAVQVISGGTPVSVSRMMEWIGIIGKNAAQQYEEKNEEAQA